jgi:hypothetical protein
MIWVFEISEDAVQRGIGSRQSLRGGTIVLLKTVPAVLKDKSSSGPMEDRWQVGTIGDPDRNVDEAVGIRFSAAIRTAGTVIFQLQVDV